MHVNQRGFHALLLGLILTVTINAIAQVREVEQQAAQQITATTLRAHTTFLADDLLEGRAPGTRGGQLAEKYIASQFELLGLVPGAKATEGSPSWYQSFEIVGVTSHVPKTLTLKSGAKSLTLKFWDDFIAYTGEQKPRVTVKDAEIVFVGYGIEAPEQKWDDYKGADVRGKILLMMNNDPETDPNLFAGKTRLYYGRWTYKYEIAARKGAAGVIIIHTTPSAGYKFQVVQTSWTGEQFELPHRNDQPAIKIKAWATDTACKQIALLGGKNLDELRAKAERRDFKPVPLGVTLSLEIENSLRSLKTANVLGVLPGRDPELRDEYVVYSAHHDHLGIGTPSATGDSIYNGALDNASGTAAMLAIAQAFASLPAEERPRRSIMFAAVAAEESGLLGSQKFCVEPPVPAGYLAANINIDGVNIWGRTKDIAVIGLGKSSLDHVVKEIAGWQGRVVKGDQFPEKGFFYRSDQFNFAKIGVPATYFDTGVEFIGRPPEWGKEQMEKWEATNYHQVSDEYEESWNLEGAVEDAQLAFLVGLKVANADQMPSWMPGDEFEAARKKARESVSSEQ
ncbi:MAG: M28 family peptidase [candidate division KSB1 bacterium]|nr:M28 family peptidase [candidate division KSB1 bacterium]MDZ7303295.1 M28 family peptidase [candidate division KSB1 bacterium]MDZ7312598.1 M28 family peptidase [candidate division KSB1 bacterium]